MSKQLRTDGGEDDDGGKAKPISIYLPPHLIERVRELAQEEERTVSGVIKRMIVQQLQDA